MTTIKWMAADPNPPVKERLLLIVSAAGQPLDVQLMGKSEIKIGYWTGDTFRLMSERSQPIVTHWARLAPMVPVGINLIHQRIFDADVRE